MQFNDGIINVANDPVVIFHCSWLATAAVCTVSAACVLYTVYFVLCLQYRANERSQTEQGAEYTGTQP